MTTTLELTGLTMTWAGELVREARAAYGAAAEPARTTRRQRPEERRARITWIKREIAAGRYDTPARAAHAAQALFERLTGREA